VILWTGVDEVFDLWVDVGVVFVEDSAALRNSQEEESTCWLPILLTPTSLLTSLLNLSPFTSPRPPSPLRVPRDNLRTN